MIKEHITHKCDRCDTEQIKPFKYSYLCDSVKIKFSIFQFKHWLKSQFTSAEFNGYDGRNHNRPYDLCNKCAKIFLTKALESLEELEK